MVGYSAAVEDALGWAVEQDDQFFCRDLNGLVQVAEFDGELSHFTQRSGAGDQDIGRDEVDRQHRRRRVSDQDVAVTEMLAADAQEDSDAGSSAALALQGALGAIEPGEV